MTLWGRPSISVVGNMEHFTGETKANCTKASSPPRLYKRGS